MSTWSDAPKIQGPPQTGDVAVLLDYVKKLANITAKMAKDLEFILNGNVAFDNIRTNGIEAKNIKAGSITTEKLQAGSVTADKIMVNELSAISANLGHIIAGLIESVEIYGSYIATRRGGYPRAEMSQTEDMFSTYASPSSYVKMAAVGTANGSPQLTLSGGGDSVILYQQSQRSLLHSTKNLMVSSSYDIELSPSSRGRVWVSFAQLCDNDTGKSLSELLGLG
ncbi:hypothetical protein [Paenibacillus motobuensis]|uniref:Uncharacterized protein n=1 Tax=Paenibacillus motobuensis TaxID=295324 RepID=A0ABP3HWL0_9BACL